MAPPFLPLVLAPPVCLCLSLRASACLFMRACIDLNVCVRESLRACVRACVLVHACAHTPFAFVTLHLIPTQNILFLTQLVMNLVLCLTVPVLVCVCVCQYACVRA